MNRARVGSGHGYCPQPFKVIQENRQDFVLLRGYATSMEVGEMEIYSVARRMSALNLWLPPCCSSGCRVRQWRLVKRTWRSHGIAP